jgi:tRNA pseudouridine38-40 synthase
LPRYKLTIEYDGGPFSGWQRVGEGRMSVQQALEEATQRFCGQPVDVIGSGRTDAGVHALGQVAHIDLPKPYRVDTIRDALNAQLRPHPVAVLEAEAVGDDFHARFSATERVYWYRIVNRRPDLALERGRAWRQPQKLNADAMHEAAQALVGRHDFSTFRDSQCQAASPEKTLDRCDVSRVGEEVHVWCAARSFLHRQVRSMVGTLVEVGRGQWRVGDVARAIAAKDRTQCGPVAPPDGLYLVRVGFTPLPAPQNP